MNDVYEEYSRQEIGHDPLTIRIYHNRPYRLHELEDLLLPLFKTSYTSESMRVTIESANHIWSVYKNDGCLACALATDIGSYGGFYLMLFGVQRSVQGRGIGKCLLDAIIRWSRQQGRTFIYLHTEIDNTNAIRFYEKAGFHQQIAAGDSFDQMPQYGPDAVPMMLSLT